MKFRCFFTIIILFCTIFAGDVSALVVNDTAPIKVGLKYGESAMEQVKVESDGGFSFGYLPSSGDGFYTVYDVLSKTITVRGDKTYQVEFLKEFQTAEQAKVYLTESGAGDGFLAYENGSYYVRVGNYATAAEADAKAVEMSSAFLCKPSKADNRRIEVLDGDKTVFEYLDAKPFTAKGASDSMKITNSYLGYFQFISNEGKITLINAIDIQDYLKGVVPTEMSSSWNKEALKAQAVAARNYTLNNLSKHKNQGFAICADVHCQAYSGMSRMAENSNKAVDETDGMVATYNGKLAELFYHASSGGYTENSENVWNTALPYLVAVDTPYEELTKENKGIWKNEVSAQALTTHFRSKKGYETIGNIVKISVTKRTKADNVYSIEVEDDLGKKYTFSKESARSILGSYVNSLRYTITAKGSSGENGYYINAAKASTQIGEQYAINGKGKVEKIGTNIGDIAVVTGKGVQTLSSGGATDASTVYIFEGTGWGHQVGMSQRSAKGMAEHGSNYEEILKHFFKGIALEKIN